MLFASWVQKRFFAHLSPLPVRNDQFPQISPYQYLFGFIRAVLSAVQI